jgi:hypothetical protein
MKILINRDMMFEKRISVHVQSTARDFAQAKDWESYTKKDMAHHFGTFFISGLGGVLQGHAGENGKKSSPRF